jgi:glycosyltransferase involved in cell wall biosynthesis
MHILVDGQTLESAEINRGIGVYFKNVLNNMIKQSYEHKWYITVSNVDYLRVLDPWVITRLIPVVNNAFAPNGDFSRTAEFTGHIRNAIEKYDIDLLWIPNPLMVNVLFPNETLNCKVFATIYDLIPYVMPIKEWSNNVQQEYNRRLAYLNQNNVNMICISEATKNDVVKCMGSKNMHVTFLAADSKLFYKKRLKAGINAEPYIVFTGGFDYRKNMYGAIEAFKRSTELYPGTVMDKVSMYIVCKGSEDDKVKFYDKVKKMGLEGRIKLTGFISDQELADLYANSDVFFFPSLYEGFGCLSLRQCWRGIYFKC